MIITSIIIVVLNTIAEYILVDYFMEADDKISDTVKLCIVLFVQAFITYGCILGYSVFSWCVA